MATITESSLLCPLVDVKRILNFSWLFNAKNAKDFRNLESWVIFQTPVSQINYGS